MGYSFSSMTLHPNGYWYGNYFLSSANTEEYEMKKTNAAFIRNRLLDAGWSKNAIAGFLGNVDSESGLNPGIWQSGDTGNTSGGYGLTQWTPATKYLNWCDDNGLVYHEMESALARIFYEIDNGLQWVRRSEFNKMTFKQFIISNEAPALLARCFVASYEIPRSYLNGGADRQATYERRGNNAEKWYEYCFGESAPPYTPGNSTTNGGTLSKLLLFAVGSDL